MKKAMMAALMLAGISAMAEAVVTNTVVIVSNHYNNVYHENIITQKIKSSHTYVTNHVTTVERQTLVVSKTNLTVTADIGLDVLRAASNQANRAEAAYSNAVEVVGSGASSASEAAVSASDAAAAAASAAAERQSAAAECDQALSNINARISWFDEHAGETITNVNINVTKNIYNNEDMFARTQLSNVEERVTYLEENPYNPFVTYWCGGVWSFLLKNSGGILVATVEVDSSDYRRRTLDGYAIFDYAFTNKFNPSYTSLSPPRVMRVYKRQGDDRLRVTVSDLTRSVTFQMESTVSTEYLSTNTVNVSNPTASFGYATEPVYVREFLGPDLGIYDGKTNLIDRLARWSEITNWVERNFQRK